MSTDPANIKKLEKVLSVVNYMEEMTKNDLLKSFETVISFVKDMREKNIEMLNIMSKAIDDSLKDTKERGMKDMDAFKNEMRVCMENEVVAAEEVYEKLSESIKKKVEAVRDGIDGKSIIGPKGEDGKDGSPDTPEQVRDKLEILEGDDRLDKSAIKGLEDLFKGLAGVTKSSFSIWGASRNAVEYTDISSQLNGVLKVFLVPKRRYIALFYSSFPYILRPVTDYIGDGTAQLTLTSEISAPPAGQTLILLHSRV